MNNNTVINNVKYIFSDRIINPFINLIIRLRGSKKLFKSSEKAKSEIKKLENNQRPYIFNFKFSSKNRLLSVCDMNCVVLSQKENKSEKVIVYFPGGAFVRELTKLHLMLADKLCAETGADVILCAYPKAPTNKAEHTYELLLSLYRNLLNDYLPKNIVFMGDSAGGTVALSFMQWLKFNKLSMPGAVVLFSPLMDITMSNPEIPALEKTDPMLAVNGLKELIISWQGSISENSPLINPISGDMTVLPKIRLFCGSKELITPDARKYSEKASKTADIQLFEYKGMYHCFVLYPLKAAKAAKNEAVKFIKEL